MPRGAKGSLGAVVPLDAYRYCQRGSGGSLGSVQPGSVRRAEAEKRARNWKRCHGNQDRKASWPPKPDLKSKLDARNMFFHRGTSPGCSFHSWVSVPMLPLIWRWACKEVYWTGFKHSH
ncbi:uncharacterized protein LOC144287987 isoform X3 [Canis aureus]